MWEHFRSISSSNISKFTWYSYLFEGLVGTVFQVIHSVETETVTLCWEQFCLVHRLSYVIQTRRNNKYFSYQIKTAQTISF